MVQTILDLYKLFLAGIKAIFHLTEFYLLNHVQKVLVGPNQFGPVQNDKRTRQASRFSCNNFFYKPKFGSFFCLIQHAWPFYKNSAVRNWFLFRKKTWILLKKKCYPEFRSLIFQIWVISSRKKRPQLAHTNRWQPRSYFFVPRLSFVPCSLLIVRHVFKVTYQQYLFYKTPKRQASFISLFLKICFNYPKVMIWLTAKNVCFSVLFYLDRGFLSSSEYSSLISPIFVCL